MSSISFLKVIDLMPFKASTHSQCFAIRKTHVLKFHGPLKSNRPHKCIDTRVEIERKGKKWYLLHLKKQ